MDKQAADMLAGQLSPVVDTLGLDLVDVEISASTVRVTVDRAGGIDLDAVAAANRAVSSVLDRIDPLPGRYTLEVTSPGLERRLRTPAHFSRALGETVVVRLQPGVTEERRLSGRLVATDDDGIVVEGSEVPGGTATIAYTDIERARTVFEWGPAAQGPRSAQSPSRARPKGTERAAKEKARTP